MKTLPEIITQVCGETYVAMAQAVFDDSGVDAIFLIMETVKNLYKHVEPSRIGGRVVVYQKVLPVCVVTPNRTGLAADFADLGNRSITDLTLEVTSDGRAYASVLEGTIEDLARSAVVYHSCGAYEEFLAGSERKQVPRLDPSARSQFSIPTFSSLREALQHYSRENIRESTCYVFEKVWDDAKRLFLKAKPEVTMRRSLTQFLRNRFCADHDVWPEQNVNEKNPVDIRVRPRLTNNRLMLVEIKWLGDSVADDGHITTSYREARAQEGADQLAGYLEEQLRFAPSHVIQGYYIIIDARRRGLRAGDTSISKTDGMYFENQDLTFSPAQHDIRQDFDPPIRMFARPIFDA
jgi:hypothetical protein